ncbi:uncharacterized protein [Watersipora subatra]|uniref:uncharacterized protein n=1 Tax=Watersipora subatra TaxID=2589382 RepID=UPI00355C76DE
MTSNGISSVHEFVQELYRIDAIKLGSFTLKSGITSPIYFDLRVMISYPNVLVSASSSVHDILCNLHYDSICGVPYTALPIASCVSTTHNVPMLLKRKEAKSYGTKKILEGVYKTGDECVIIEDVVTSGGSVLEAATCLRAEGLVVTHVIALLDREQGGRQNLEKNGITLHSIMTVNSVLSSLLASKKITAEQSDDVKEFIMKNQLDTSPVPNPIEDIVLRLHDIGSFRFGSFKLSNGMITPIYIDLRLVISHPVLMADICKELYKLVSGKVEFDILCGVPYAALHLATCMANEHNLNNVLLRKVLKAYGTGKLIEGVYKQGQKCLIVEDVMVSGQGIYEAVESIKSQGLTATDALLVLDREQNGADNLKTLGINLHCLIRVSEALSILVKHKRIDSGIADQVNSFLSSNPAQIPFAKKESRERTSQINELLPFAERASLCTNPVAKRLFTIMSEKQSNVCVSADVTSMAELLQLADDVGPYICALKTHVDILDDFDFTEIKRLVEISQQHNFVIFEDRKFADIGSTVRQQYEGGMYRISDWAELTNAHSIPGPGIVEALKQVGLPKQRACLLLAEMSSKGNLANASYSFATVSMAQENNDFVIGFISQSKLTSDPTLIHMTPGVKISGEAGDKLGQRYVSPEEAVRLRGADVIIVGRGITMADDRVAATKMYQQAAYSSYESLRKQQISNR